MAPIGHLENYRSLFRAHLHWLGYNENVGGVNALKWDSMIANISSFLSKLGAASVVRSAKLHLAPFVCCNHIFEGVCENIFFSAAALQFKHFNQVCFA